MNVVSSVTLCCHPPDNFFVRGNMDRGSRTHQLRRQLQFNRTRSGGVIDFGFYQKSLSLMQRRPAEITVQLDDQKSNGQDRDQKRRERQPQIAAGSAQNSARTRASPLEVGPGKAGPQASAPSGDLSPGRSLFDRRCSETRSPSTARSQSKWPERAGADQRKAGRS